MMGVMETVGYTQSGAAEAMGKLILGTVFRTYLQDHNDLY